MTETESSFMPVYMFKLVAFQQFWVCNGYDFCPHVIFAVSWHRICEFTEVMIGNT